MALPEDDAPPGVPEWVVTYGDMMSLLLTFFIMLVSMSELKTENGKMRAALDSLRESFGNTAGRRSTPGESLQETSVLDQLMSAGAASEGGIEKAGRDSQGPAGPATTVEIVDESDSLTQGGKVTFDRYSTKLTAEARKSLRAVASELNAGPELVLIRGHASPERWEVGYQFSSHAVLGRPILDKLDLSYVRAIVVADYLSQQGVSRVRLRISAAGDAHPTFTRTGDQQRRNRRVDVFTIPRYIPKALSTKSPDIR